MLLINCRALSFMLIVLIPSIASEQHCGCSYRLRQIMYRLFKHQRKYLTCTPMSASRLVSPVVHSLVCRCLCIVFYVYFSPNLSLRCHFSLFKKHIIMETSIKGKLMRLPVPLYIMNRVKTVSIKKILPKQ